MCFDAAVDSAVQKELSLTKEVALRLVFRLHADRWHALRHSSKT
jgi:hypothetical protein